MLVIMMPSLMEEQLEALFMVQWVKEEEKAGGEGCKWNSLHDDQIRNILYLQNKLIFAIVQLGIRPKTRQILN